MAHIINFLFSQCWCNIVFVLVRRVVALSVGWLSKLRLEVFLFKSNGVIIYTLLSPYVCFWSAKKQNSRCGDFALIRIFDDPLQETERERVPLYSYRCVNGVKLLFVIFQRTFIQDCIV